MINCEHLWSTKVDALKELLALLKSAMFKGKFSKEILNEVYTLMASLVQAKFSGGASVSEIRNIVNTYLDSVVDQAKKNVASGNTVSSTTGTPSISSLFGSGSQSGSSVFGQTGTGSFFDPSRGVSPSSGTDWSSLPSRNPNGTAVGGFDSTGNASGIEITASELRDYYNGIVPMDNDNFAIGLWISKSQNPALILNSLAYAKRLHNDVILPCARYYKKLMYGDPEYPTRVGQVLYGIVSPKIAKNELSVGPTSRHLLGQAVNFSIVGVDHARVVEDISARNIEAYPGTYALTAGVHASLPFVINGVTVSHLLLWQDSSVPGFVGYKFT